jgi:hypothetical protein
MPPDKARRISGDLDCGPLGPREVTDMHTPSYPRGTAPRWTVLTAAVAAAVVLALGSFGPAAGTAPARAAAGECGLPAASPLWIDYAEGSVKPDTRAILSKPGVVVATSGTALGTTFRKAGVGTTYFELHLPRIVGETDDAADASTIIPAADALYAKAVATTDCQTPWIALNELQGSQAPMATWSPQNLAYRANVLTLVQRLAERGAHPALLVHGNPTFAGDTALWWQTASKSSHLIYEAYYDASKMYPLGSLIASRRMRIGMRNVIAQFEAAGVPRARLGFMFGFHSALTPGIAGRQGLEPTEAWLRVVKWETFAANQIAKEYGLRTLWSWGWGTFGPESVDEDKAVAACTWLWARDPALCDAPALAGPAFQSSRAEAQLAVPTGTTCTFANGRVSTSAVDRLTKLTKDRHAALTAQFSRAALTGAAPVARSAVLAVENRAIKNVFKGSRPAYERALAMRGADDEVARGLIADELRRRTIATTGLQGAPTLFDRVAAIESAAVDSAICLNDLLPGVAEPIGRGNAIDVGTMPLLKLLPFLFQHKLAPAVPTALAATRASQSVTLSWTSGSENDLAGYEVYRTTQGGVPQRLNDHLVGVPTFVDAPSPAGTTYTIRAVDTSGNASGWTAPVTS